MGIVQNTKARWAQDGLVSETSSSFLAVAVEDETLAGWVTWKPIGTFSTYEIGIALLPEHRGHGIGTTAQRLLVEYLFNTTAAHRIQAATEEDNLAERRSLESVGFRCEGVNRGVAFRDGKWRNGVMYGLLREDVALAND